MSLKTREYPLDRSHIPALLDDLRDFLNSEQIQRQNALRLCLTLEELLLRIMEHDGAPDSCALTVGRRFGRPIVVLRYAGARFDPTASTEEGGWSSLILSNLGLSPEWSFRSGVNTLRLRPLRQGGPSRLLCLLIAAVSAGILGAAGMLLTPELRVGLTDILLTPIFNAFLGLLNTFAGLMIFFSISSGIFGIGDTSSLSNIGKVMFPRFLISIFAVSAGTLVVALPFFRLTSAETTGGVSQLREVSEMIFNILPSNPIQPFLSNNSLQIIVLALFTGLALLILGKRAQNVGMLVSEAGVLMQTLLEQVCRLIPLFVFVSLLRQIWNGSAPELLGLWKPFCIYLLANLVYIIVLLVSASLRAGASPLHLLRKALPAFFIAFTTASSMAAFSTASDACENKLGISRKLYDLGLPVGLVIYMPAGTITFSVLALHFAELYGVEVNLVWLITALLLSAVLSIAIPPMPGAMLTCYGIMIAQLGIPSQALLLAAALDVAVDFFSTGFDVLMIQLELVNQAKRLSMLNRDTLLKE